MSTKFPRGRHSGLNFTVYFELRPVEMQIPIQTDNKADKDLWMTT